MSLGLAAILRDNVELTMGCTDPITPALAAAAAQHAVGGRVIRIRAVVSRDIFKGAYAVGVPHTGAAGIRVALLLGAAIGDAAPGLMLFAAATEEQVRRALQMVDEVEVEVLPDREKPAVFAHVVLWTTEGIGHATVHGRHDAVVNVGRGDAPPQVCAGSNDVPTYAGGLSELKTATLQDFVVAVERAAMSDLEPVVRGLVVNSALDSADLQSRSAMDLGDTEDSLSGESWINQARAHVIGAIEARMTGLPVPVMAVFGSGNQGIVLFRALRNVEDTRGMPADRVVRAGALGVLLAGAMNAAFDRGSPFCDCVLVASPALAGAAAWLLGAEPPAVSRAIASTASAFSGLLCDGAKPSCAFRAGAGTSLALETASLLAKLGNGPPPAMLGEGDWRQVYSDIAQVAAVLRDPAEDALVEILKRRQ